MRRFGLGFTNTVSNHNIHGFSVLSHVMQFHSGNAVTAKLEREAHQRLMAAPRFTFTTAFLAQAKRCHFPHALHVLSLNGKAAQYRFAMSTSKVFRRCEQLLRDILHFNVGDELCSEYRINPLANSWWDHSIMCQIMRTTIEAHSMAPQLEDREPQPQLQKKMAEMFLLYSGMEPPVATINRRLCRFLQPATVAALSVYRTLDTIAMAKQPFLIATAAKTWLNGWCTSRRYQLQVQPCHFGCGKTQGDQLEHYCCCPILWSFLRLHAPLMYHDCHHNPDNYDDNSTLLFLGLHAPPDRHRTLTAIIFLHTFFVTYETLRSHQHSSRVQDYTDKTGMLTTTLHFTLTKHPDLHDVLTPWTPRPQYHVPNTRLRP